jgi:dipeptidyl aminopeptidase/acylaminoacyl peptidase
MRHPATRVVLLATVASAVVPAAAAGASNGVIAFDVAQADEVCDQCGPDGNSEITGGGLRTWLVRPDGRNLRRLPCSPDSRCGSSRPAFSKDGRRLAVERDTGVALMTARGRELRRIELSGWSPAWAPGGKRLAFGSSYPVPGSRYVFAISVLDLGGGESRRLYDDVGFAWDIAWSRQGRLAWAVSDGGGRSANGIWVGDRAGRRKKHISSGGHYVAWSPDGSRIAYLGDALRVMDADGGRKRVLTRKCTVSYDEEGGVAWSPDGREIACRSRRGNLVVLNLPTMTLRSVATSRGFGEGSVGDISWRPVPAH